MEKNKVEKKKNYSTNRLSVRIIAGILAFLMVASLLATIVSFFIK